MNRSSRTLILLYVLFGYVIIQFVWWGVLLYDLNMEAAGLNKNAGDALGRTLTMIIGEGVVFLFLLLTGAFYIRKYLLREQNLARQERNFLLATTHEFNSPIAAAKLNLQTLKRKEINPTLQAQVVDGALSAITRLESLVSNVLMASRIDSGRFVLHREKIDMDLLLKGVVRRMDQLLHETGNHVSLKVHQEGVFEADAAAIELVAGNLVHNAIKYAPGTCIHITAQINEGSLDLIISDEGPGVPREERKNIFKKFYRMGNEETRSKKGTGLGLYLVRELIHMHGGAIELEQNKPSGALFKIYIPQEA